MTEKHKCQHRIQGRQSSYFHNCKRPATVEEEGSWWCVVHSPSDKAKRLAERQHRFISKINKNMAYHSWMGEKWSIARRAFVLLGLIQDFAVLEGESYRMPKRAMEDISSLISEWDKIDK